MPARTAPRRGDRRRAAWRLDSSYRGRRPEQTLAIAEGLMARCGISRVTDITRMDRLGLPVYASVRPRSRTLRVHAGKGLQPLHARIGAVMEAIEYAAAEPHASQWEMQPLAVADIAAQFDAGVHFVDLVPPLGLKISPARRLPTVECETLRRRGTIRLPAELIFLPCEVPGFKRLFGSGTTGLASGNSVEEATLHALFEIIERDAGSMNKARDASQWVDVETLPEPFRSLAADWHASGVELVVRHLPNEFDIACFEAFIDEPASSNVNLAGGSGAHADREVALTRAICEAAQSRLSHIHGGRDDITTFFSKYADTDRAAREKAEAETRRGIFDRRQRVRYTDLPDGRDETLSVNDMLAGLLRRLSRCGFGTVFRHRFNIDLDGLQVVKVVVPKCEDVEQGPRRIGPRLLSRIVGHG